MTVDSAEVIWYCISMTALVTARMNLAETFVIANFVREPFGAASRPVLVAEENLTYVRLAASPKAKFGFG